MDRRRIRLFVFLLIICLCTWMIPGNVFAEENTETDLKGHSFDDVVIDEETHQVCSVCGIDFSEYEENGTACKRTITYKFSVEEIVESYNYGESVQLIEDNTLTGWNTEADGSGKSYIFGENDVIPSIEEDMILYCIPKGHRIAIENVTGHGTIDVLADLQNTLEGEYVEFCIYVGDDYTLSLLEITKDDGSGEAISYNLFRDEVPVVDDPEYENGYGSQTLTKCDLVGSFIMPACDVKIKALFDFNTGAMGDQKTYTVSFDLMEGGVDVQTVVEGERAIKPIDPVRRGYVFDGWYYYDELTLIEDCVDLYPFDEPVTHDINLIGKWKKSEEQQEEELIRINGHVFRQYIPECVISYDFEDHPVFWECMNCGAETMDPYSDIGTCEGDGSHPGPQDEYNESDSKDPDDRNGQTEPAEKVDDSQTIAPSGDQPEGKTEDSRTTVPSDDQQGEDKTNQGKTTETSDKSGTKTNEPSTKSADKTNTSSVITVGSGKYKMNKKNKTAMFYAPKKKTAKKIVIPATVKVSGKTYKVTGIRSNAFKGCKKLTSVSIGKYVTSIGKNAFYGCKKLKTVKGSVGVKSIKSGAFMNCKALTTAKISNKVTSIGSKAFYGCSSLKTVTIGKSTATISKQAFYKCSKLKTVNIKSSKLKKVYSKAFKSIYSKAKIKVPKKKLKVYKKLLKGKIGTKAKVIAAS